MSQIEEKSEEMKVLEVEVEESSSCPVVAISILRDIERKLL